MSLLNDALRDLEKRQQREPGGGAPIPPALDVGAGRTPYGRLPLVGAVVLVSVVVGGAGWWFWSGSEPVSDSTEIVRSTITPESTKALAAPGTREAPGPVMEPIPEGEATPEPEVAETVAVESARELDNATESVDFAAQPEVVEVEVEGTPAPQQSENDTGRSAREDEVSEGSTEVADSTAGAEPVTAAANDVRSSAPSSEGTDDSQERPRVRELTPQERERQLTREIEQLLDQGNERLAAERLQRHLLLDSDAPRARAAMGSHYMRQGRLDEARGWLPERVAELYPELRMLRARLALADGSRERALEWLVSDIPSVERYSDYHAMKATLYQQLDQPGEAVRVWGRLLETDDARGAWWAGLGIALESMGRRESAQSAYMQAALLPDLPDALRDYVEQRLSRGQG